MLSSTWASHPLHAKTTQACGFYFYWFPFAPWIFELAVVLRHDPVPCRFCLLMCDKVWNTSYCLNEFNQNIWAGFFCRFLKLLITALSTRHPRKGFRNSSSLVDSLIERRLVLTIDGDVLSYTQKMSIEPLLVTRYVTPQRGKYKNQELCPRRWISGTRSR